MRRKNLVETLLVGAETYDAFIVKSPANIAYLIGITFPFPEQSPYQAALVARKDDHVYTLVIPVEWDCVLKGLSWKGKTKKYSINEGSPDNAFHKALKAVIEGTGIETCRVGIDYPYWTAGEIKFLKAECGGMQIVDIDPILTGMREIKTPDEIANIQTAAHIADRGIIGALNHVEGTTGNIGYTMAEFLERIRIHAIEFGANSIGHLNLSQGSSGHSWYTPIYDFSMVEEGNTIRVDYSVSYKGYWTNCSRMFFVGKPGQHTRQAYEENMTLKNFAVSILKPGIRVTEFCEAVRLKAEEEDIELLFDEGLGHGIGVSENEKPYLTVDNEDVLKTGMVIALDVKTIGSKDEIIHSVDVYELTEDGNRKLSDFRDWSQMYLINGVRATH